MRNEWTIGVSLSWNKPKNKQTRKLQFKKNKKKKKQKNPNKKKKKKKNDKQIANESQIYLHVLKNQCDVFW